MKAISHNRPTLGGLEKKAVCSALASGWIAQGDRVREFEAAFHRRLGFSGRAVATSSGTAALHLALLGLKVGPGDEVLVPTYACTALLHAVRYTGARPVPCDVRPWDLNLDPADAERRRRRRTRGAIVTHTFGFPMDLAPFGAMGLWVIEDCAQALGARWAGRPVGTRGDAAVFSFGATKPMTSGAGGMVAARHPGILDAARDLRDYDKRTDGVLRFNYQMTDIAAALGRVQLERLGSFVARRRRAAAAYRKALARVEGVSFQETAAPSEPSYYRFVIRISNGAEDLVRRLARRRIEAIQPIAPRSMLHRCLGLPRQGFPGAEEVARRIVSLPNYPTLSSEDQARVIGALQDILKKC